MRLPLAQMDRVASYLSGRMTADQQARFEADLLVDSDLQDQLEFQREMMQVIQRRALRAEIAAAGKSFGGHSGWSWTFAIAGGAVVLVATALIYFFSSDKPVATANSKEVVSIDSLSVQNFIPETTNEAAAGLEPTYSTYQFPAVPSREKANEGLFPSSSMELPVDMYQKLPLKNDLIEAKSSQVSFAPEGFKELIAKYLPVDGARNISPEMEDMLYFETAYPEVTEAVSNYSEVLTTEIWKGRRLIQGTARISGNGKSKLTIHRKETAIQVTDADGKCIPGAEIEYNYFGEPRVGTTDSMGVIRFPLYSTIRSELHITLRDKRQTKLEKVTIEPKRVLFIQLSGSVMKYVNRTEKTTSYQIPDNCGYVDPLAVQVIRSMSQGMTFLSSEQFLVRLNKLQTMENGQTLLEVYIDHINLPLNQADSIVASLLPAGNDKAIFQLFAQQSYQQTPEVNQLQFSSDYRKSLALLRIQLAQKHQFPGHDPKMMRELGEFVAPCRRK